MNGTDSFILENQAFEDITQTLKKSDKILKSRFQAAADLVVNLDDLKRISPKIVILCFPWMITGKKCTERNKDLTFHCKDLDRPGTRDLSIQFFKKKYPDAGPAMCAAMLKMSFETFKETDKNRQDLQDMF